MGNLIFLAKMGFGMESMVAMLCMFSDNFCEKEKLIADFGGVSTGGLEIVNDGVMGGVSEGGWKIVNDDVMGGVSQGASRAAKNVMVFEGNVSLENNGGFSSVQMKGKWNLSTFQGIKLRVKGDGKKYQIYVESDARYYWMPITFMGDFHTIAGQWQEIHIPFAAMKPRHWGKDLSNHGVTLNKAKIQKMALIISKQPGPFRLEVDWIKAV